MLLLWSLRNYHWWGICEQRVAVSIPNLVVCSWEFVRCGETNKSVTIKVLLRIKVTHTLICHGWGTFSWLGSSEVHQRRGQGLRNYGGWANERGILQPTIRDARIHCSCTARRWNRLVTGFGFQNNSRQKTWIQEEKRRWTHGTQYWLLPLVRGLWNS